MACRATRRNRVLLSGGLHPHYRAVTETTLQFTEVEIESLGPDPLGIEDILGRINEQTACVIVQNPGFFGSLRDYSVLASACHESGALLVVAVAEPMSLGLIMPPGAMGADIVVAEGQSIGNGLNFGGPGLGLFATRDKLLRQMPGRLVGETTDSDGRRGWVLTLSTREQHIRREKATSNICTNSGLCALAFTIHMTMLGEEGFAKLARLNHAKAVTLAQRLEKTKGVKLLSRSFFNEFALMLTKPATDVVEQLAQRGILAGVPAARFYPTYEELRNVLLVTATETNSDDDFDALATGLAECLA
jgi:glycine dehydrogenase subunit 1